MLAEQLQQQLTLINTLQSILEAETTCLKEKNFSSLKEILSDKQNALQQIASIDDSLIKNGLQKALAENEKLQQLKQEIDKQLRSCKKSNDINGQLVTLSMKSNKHLMQILKQETGKNSVTYNNKGSLTSASLLGQDIKA
ncbi:flagellar protein FlgN [Psychromonas sp. MME2]|uniref:flagella synthesis protein FlgN n=1 Tax=unclassified Psychromonas TaxID=2614957 RepID=UPI00339C13DB